MPTLGCKLRTQQVADIARVPYDTLHYWAKSGLIPEPMVPARGTGNRRVWGFVDVVRACLVARLRRENVSVQAVRKALGILADEWHVQDPLTSGRLLAIDGEPYYLPDDTAVVNVLSRQHAMKRVVLVDLGELSRQTAEKVMALAVA